jgi:hypothetical protein
MSLRKVSQPIQAKRPNTQTHETRIVNRAWRMWSCDHCSNNSVFWVMDNALSNRNPRRGRWFDEESVRWRVKTDQTLVSGNQEISGDQREKELEDWCWEENCNCRRMSNFHKLHGEYVIFSMSEESISVSCSATTWQEVSWMWNSRDNVKLMCWKGCLLTLLWSSHFEETNFISDNIFTINHYIHFLLVLYVTSQNLSRTYQDNSRSYFWRLTHENETDTVLVVGLGLCWKTPLLTIGWNVLLQRFADKSCKFWAV